MASTRWTEEETATLRRLAARMVSAKEIAREVGRTHAAVAIRAKVLKIKLPRTSSPNNKLTLQLLAKRAMTGRELADALGILYVNVHKVTNRLRAAGLVRISQYKRGLYGGSPTPTFALGHSRDDARRPPPFPATAIQRRYIKNMRRDRPEEYALKVKRTNIKRTTKPKRDAAAAWI